ncbi:unknown [Clostridium sp. CAG:768]|nr:unknown [Clostridium sp. CAG:768]
MDVYIKGNKIEKELYTQMNEKAKNANKEEKAKLKEQYMQIKAAKNQVPDFIK